MLVERQVLQVTGVFAYFQPFRIADDFVEAYCTEGTELSPEKLARSYTTPTQSCVIHPVTPQRRKKELTPTVGSRTTWGHPTLTPSPPSAARSVHFPKQARVGRA